MNMDKRRWQRPDSIEKADFQNLPESQKIKTAKGRKLSSTRWLQRHFSDPYVKAAHKLGFRSRAAFKLQELNDRFHFLSKGSTVIDLGAAPGGWTQIALKEGAKYVLGIDLLPVEPLTGADFVQMDFTEENSLDKIKKYLGTKVDIVLSDMAAPVIGHQKADQLRTELLAETSAHFALEILNSGGCFITKVFQGGAEPQLIQLLRRNFRIVKHAKPPSSRSESPETYILGLSYKKGSNS